jgi:hypothetical protein
LFRARFGDAQSAASRLRAACAKYRGIAAGIEVDRCARFEPGRKGAASRIPCSGPKFPAAREKIPCTGPTGIHPQAIESAALFSAEMRESAVCSKNSLQIPVEQGIRAPIERLELLLPYPR